MPERSLNGFCRERGPLTEGSSIAQSHTPPMQGSFSAGSPLSAGSPAACAGGGAGALLAGVAKTCRAHLHHVRVTDAKAVGVGNPLLEGYCFG